MSELLKLESLWSSGPLMSLEYFSLMLIDKKSPNSAHYLRNVVPPRNVAEEESGEKTRGGIAAVYSVVERLSRRLRQQADECDRCV